MITILAWIGGITVAYGFVKLVINFNKPAGPSILSGPGPRYGFATVGPKKDTVPDLCSVTRPERGSES